MRKLLLILLTIYLPLLSFSQNKIKLWQKPYNDYRKKDVILYNYPANDSTNSHAAIIFCPGGSYCYLAKKNEGFEPAAKFRDYGFNTFVLIYRRGLKGNRYPAQIQDLQLALKYVYNNAEKFKIDTTLIGICGFSAGGHLVGTAAEYYDKDFNNDCSQAIIKPAFAIMMYPVATMQDQFFHRKSRRNLLGQYYNSTTKDSMSLELNVRINDMPPIFLLACKDDPIVDYHNSILMDEALTKNNVEHKFYLYDQGGHGFGINPNRIKSNDKSAANWHVDFVKWFNKIFNKKISTDN